MAFLFGEALAYIAIYGLLSRIVLFLAARRSRTMRKVLIIHAIMGSLFASLGLKSEYPIMGGLAIAIAVWLAFDLWRVRPKPQRQA